MPLYEYVCDDCDTRFELRRSMDRSSEGTTCPRCEAPAHRVLSVFAAVTAGGEVPSIVGGMGGMGGCGFSDGGGCPCAH